MIDITKNENSRRIEKAIRRYEQAKANVANERKKENEKKRKAENRHKYMIGGIVVKYFPKCYLFEEDELNSILSAALATTECRQTIEEIEKKCAETDEIEQTTATEMEESEIENEEETEKENEAG